MRQKPLTPNLDRINSRLTLLHSDNHLVLFRDFTLWTKVVARKKRCAKCSELLRSGSNSLRFTMRASKPKCSYLKEYCICKKCSLEILKKMVNDLEQPEVLKPTKEEIEKEEW